MITMRVIGLPAPQGSKRHVGNGRMIESSKKVGPWRAAIVASATEFGYAGLRLDGPLEVQIGFYLPRPKSHFTTKGLRESAPHFITSTPDLDKLVRSTLDGLTEAGVIADDARVVELHAGKSYVVDRLVGPYANINIIERR